MNLIQNSTQSSLSSLIKMNTLKPIEFIMPNPILLLTEWRTQNLNDHEIAFSMEHLYLLINWLLNYIFPYGFPDSIITDDFVQRPAEVIEENKLEIIDHYGLVFILFISLFLIAIFVPIIWLMIWCFCCTQSSNNQNNNKQRSRISNYNQSIPGNENLLRHGRHTNHSSSSSSRCRNDQRSSSNRHHYKVEGSCDCCVRPIFSILLLFLLVFAFLFIICSFVTNDFVHDGIRQLPKAANNSLVDFEIYLNNTQYELDILFKTNFAQLEQQIRKNLEISGEIVKNELAIISKASSVDNLTQIVTNLQPILQDLKKLINNTNELKFLTVQLRGKISRIKEDIEDFFKQCNHEICFELEEKYQQIRHSLSISSRIESLPRLSPIIDKIQYLLDRNIIAEIKKGKEKLDIISNDIQKKVNEIVPLIRSNISQANKALVENVDDINIVLAQPIQYIRLVQRFLSNSNDFIQQNNQHIHHVGLVSIMILFIILICYFFGLLTNLCKDQPTRFNYKNRSKKGEFFFYIGMTVFFLSFTILLSLSTISFLFGGLNDRSLCFYLENVSDPRSNKIIHLLQMEMENELLSPDITEQQDSSFEMKQMFKYLKKIDMIDIIYRCHQNQSLFNVLKLSIDQKILVSKSEQKTTSFNLSEIIVFKEKNNIQKYLNSLLNRLNINPTNFVLLSDEGKELLKVLKETPLETLNFSGFANSIKHSITPIDLELLAKKLENESNRLPDYEIENIAKLRNIVLDLRSSKELINLIIQKIENLTKNAERIEMKSQFNGKSLRETLNILLRQANEAQQFINQKGRLEIRNVLKNYIEDLSMLLTQYSDHVEQRVKNEIGRCEPVSRAYNHTVSSLCDNVVLPFTASWFSVTITLMVFIPATLLVCLLNTMFKRIKRSSSRRESILIIDHFEEDDIPLAEIDKRNRNSHNNRNRPVVPSAPHIAAFNERDQSEEETWSPGAIPQHLYSRPPPYNF
ncbi:Prominin [Dermatophagoides pteronyssinus]|uniref:Prominin n=2 Tax=Dermatophagoides pteronyssinus TaxID=6956 RepID=A0ABQ8J270_DERPT|nr:Prominin [Dermatophagoides pteronyssinus]